MKLHNKRRLHHLALFHLVSMCVLLPAGTTYATIDVGNVIVPSIGHSFSPPDPRPESLPGFVYDFFIDQAQSGGGGATLSPVSLNFDNDVQVSFTVKAPAGMKFHIAVPGGRAPLFFVDLGWATGNNDLGTSLTFSVTFQDLEGTAPTFENSSVVGNNNQFFTFLSESSLFTNDLSFTAVTFTTTYQPRVTGNGVLTYQPFDPCCSTEYRFLVGYPTNQNTDPGRFVSIIPKVPPVTTTDDHDDGVCDSTDCTLREAISAANAVSGDAVITFAPGVAGTIQLTGALPNLSNNIDLQGPGANVLTVRRNTGGEYRIFNVLQSATVTISDLTIANGHLPAVYTSLGPGAGILNSGNLTLRHCVLRDNHHPNQGGGIYNEGTLTLVESTIGATFFAGSSAVFGGGLYNSSAGTATVIGCTFLNNEADSPEASSGGAIYNAGIVTISNSTFTGNVSGGLISAEGGAIFNSGTATISASTIADNRAEVANGGLDQFDVAAVGGGVVNVGSCVISNSIIARNTVTAQAPGRAAAPDCSGPFVSQGFNLIGNSDGSGGFVNGINADQVGNTLAPLDPRLDKLQDNGGPTETMALLAGSPAIDQGNSFGLTTDQRGFVRPNDLPGVPNASGGDGSDIGAFELRLTPLSVVSRKAHGSAGTFDIDLPLTGDPGIECRGVGHLPGGASGDYQLIFTFASNLVSVEGANVSAHNPTSGTGTVDSSSSAIDTTDTHRYIVNLTGVSDAQYITVTLSNVTDSVGNFSTAVSATMGVLVGDVNATKSVDGNDVSAVQSHTRQTANSSNFRFDVNATGGIDGNDVSMTQGQTRTSLP